MRSTEGEDEWEDEEDSLLTERLSTTEAVSLLSPAGPSAETDGELDTTNMDLADAETSLPRREEVALMAASAEREEVGEGSAELSLDLWRSSEDRLRLEALLFCSCTPSSLSLTWKDRLLMSSGEGFQEFGSPSAQASSSTTRPLRGLDCADTNSDAGDESLDSSTIASNSLTTDDESLSPPLIDGEGSAEESAEEAGEAENDEDADGDEDKAGEKEGSVGVGARTVK